MEFLNIHRKYSSYLPLTYLLAECPLQNACLWLSQGCVFWLWELKKKKKRTNLSFYSTSIYEVASICEKLCKTQGIHISEQNQKMPCLTWTVTLGKVSWLFRQCFKNEDYTSGENTAPMSLFPKAYISEGETCSQIFHPNNCTSVRKDSEPQWPDSEWEVMGSCLEEMKHCLRP